MYIYVCAYIHMCVCAYVCIHKIYSTYDSGAGVWQIWSNYGESNNCLSVSGQIERQTTHNTISTYYIKPVNSWITISVYIYIYRNIQIPL